MGLIWYIGLNLLNLLNIMLNIIFTEFTEHYIETKYYIILLNINKYQGIFCAMLVFAGGLARHPNPSCFRAAPSA